MANISEENSSLIQEIVNVEAEDSTGRDDEENETITPVKESHSDSQMVGNLSTMAMGRKGGTRGVVLKVEDEHELEVCIMKVGEKRGLEEDYKEVTKKLRQEDMQHSQDISISPSTSDSLPGSSDSLSTEIAEEEVTINGDEEDSDTDEAVSDNEEEEDDYFPLSGYPLVDRFPDLGCDLAEPECGCCHCDLSDKLGPTTSEPDLVLYSDRTSDTIMSDCRYFMDRQARDTGYNFWEVED